jgi:hypothetical protein
MPSAGDTLARYESLSPSLKAAVARSTKLATRILRAMLLLRLVPAALAQDSERPVLKPEERKPPNEFAPA